MADPRVLLHTHASQVLVGLHALVRALRTQQPGVEALAQQAVRAPGMLFGGQPARVVVLADAVWVNGERLRAPRWVYDCAAEQHQDLAAADKTGWVAQPIITGDDLLAAAQSLAAPARNGHAADHDRFVFLTESTVAMPPAPSVDPIERACGLLDGVDGAAIDLRVCRRAALFLVDATPPALGSSWANKLRGAGTVAAANLTAHAVAAVLHAMGASRVLVHQATALALFLALVPERSLGRLWLSCEPGPGFAWMMACAQAALGPEKASNAGAGLAGRVLAACQLVVRAIRASDQPLDLLMREQLPELQRVLANAGLLATVVQALRMAPAGALVALSSGELARVIHDDADASAHLEVLTDPDRKPLARPFVALLDAAEHDRSIARVLDPAGRDPLEAWLQESPSRRLGSALSAPSQPRASTAASATALEFDQP